MALFALGLGARGFELLLRLADFLDRGLLVLPVRAELGGFLLQLGEFLLDLRAALARGGVLLARERLALDLQLHPPALGLVELHRQAVHLHPQARGRLVHQVNRLVGQEPVGDVALGERGRRDERGILDADSVVDLVALLEAAQDGDRVGDGGLADEDRLEAAFERGVLLDVLAVFVERRRADAAQFAARQGRLEQVRRVGGAFGRARADDHVQLVNEQDHRAFRLGDRLEDGFQAVLELAAELGAGDQRAQVEREHAPVLQPFGHVALDDAPREPFDDGGLADAGIADQHGVVLRAAAEHLHHAADFLVAADHRIELAAARGGGQVAAVALERLVLAFRLLVGHALRPADGLEDRQDIRAREAGLFQDRLRRAIALGRREQQVLGADVLILERLRFLLGQLEQLAQPRRGVELAAGDLRDRIERLLEPAFEPVRRSARALEDRRHHAVLLTHQRQQQMFRRQLLLPALARDILRRLQRLLGFDRQTVRSESHRSSLRSSGEKRRFARPTAMLQETIRAFKAWRGRGENASLTAAGQAAGRRRAVHCAADSASEA